MSGDPFGWVGQTIDGKYRVDALVGEGGFGVVYRAHHLGFGDSVALKCLRVPETLGDDERASFFDSFLAEGRLLHKLSRATAGIVQALDVGAATTPGGVWTPYIVLEWLEGRTLEADLAQRDELGVGGRSLAEAVDLLDPIARALAVAHEQGVAHRDVKPANIFLADVGGRLAVKVLDFGIAKVITETRSLTKAFEATGRSLQAFTAHYGAPEQFSRRFGATGPWTDVFALALVFVELIAGRRALDGEDAAQLFVAAADPQLRPTLRSLGVAAPDEVETVLGHALAVEPKQRYTTAAELWDELLAAVAKSTGHRPPASSVPLVMESFEPSLQSPPQSVAGERVVPMDSPTQLATSSRVRVDEPLAPGAGAPGAKSRRLRGGTLLLAAATAFSTAALLAYLFGAGEPAGDPPPSASTPSPAGTSYGPRPRLLAVPAGVVPGTTTWLAEQTVAAPAATLATNLLEAHVRCEGWGLALCTESQWLRACSAQPEIAATPSWTLTAQAKGFVVRGGGQGCGARSVAQGSERMTARTGLCCERGVAVETAHRNKTFLLATTQRLLTLETVMNQRKLSKLAEILSDRVLVETKPTPKPELLRSFEQSFERWPDQWMIVDSCMVDMSTPKPAERASWSAECELLRQRSGQLATASVRWVFAGNGALTSSAELRSSRQWSAP
jgi:eukaryotic-like serine/threonine-protein kinase